MRLMCSQKEQNLHRQQSSSSTNRVDGRQKSPQAEIHHLALSQSTDEDAVLVCMITCICLIYLKCKGDGD